MRRFLLFCTLIFCNGIFCDAGEIIFCGNDKVLIIDEKTSDGENINVVWSWRASEALPQLPEKYQKYLNGIDDCKPVDGNTKILLTAGAAVLLLERETKKCLFYAHTPNAHSAEWLPDHKIAVALSVHPNGDRLEIYDVRQPEKVLLQNELRGGHGVVWIPERKRLYALGYDGLFEYSLKNWDTASPKLIFENKWQPPITLGHDLSRVSPNRLLLSGHKSVCSFDIDQKKFTPFEPLKSTPDVKSVNYFEKTDKLIYTKGENGEWWTHNIYFVNPGKKLTIPAMNIYKVRVIE
ncbi:MAG: DUF6528 family protein [Planctomycetaceae bacterium]|jgi:hypothetical protein|nr:DUF6528 family protein [Planctomycetaceae bacterium]